MQYDGPPVGDAFYHDEQPISGDGHADTWTSTSRLHHRVTRDVVEIELHFYRPAVLNEVPSPCLRRDQALD
jgi:hypothetical protein